ncbi:MAG: hypothetical protein OXP66_10380 [Candidatus Tectomicrobia bacterium]|nr:hypothetical protein [Candidatus Tectomicrobia bacterium]
MCRTFCGQRRRLSSCQPWAVGEAARLRQALAEDGETVSSRTWHLAIREWFHGDPGRRIAYLSRLTEGAPR